MTAEPADLCRAVASYGLSGAWLPLPQAPLDDTTWRTLLGRAVRHRVTGHLARALDDGALAATSGQRANVAEHHEQALGLDLRLERLLLSSVSTLEGGRIPVRVLKGSAVAHTVYPDPGLRSFGDVDLLVPGSRFDDAIELLCADGSRRRYAEPRPRFDGRFGKGACVETADGFEVDVHRTLVAGPFGLMIDTDELFGAAASFPIGGRHVGCLDAEARLVHACFHASLGDPEPRLVALRDVAQIVLCTEIDHGRVLELCRHWNCGIVVQHALESTWSTFELTAEVALLEWARGYEASPFERRALRAYLASKRSYALQMVAGLRALPGLRSKVAYARALLLPGASYVRERDGGYLRRLARGVGMLVEDRARR